MDVWEVIEDARFSINGIDTIEVTKGQTFTEEPPAIVQKRLGKRLRKIKAKTPQPEKGVPNPTPEQE